MFNPIRPNIQREKKNHCEIKVERTSRGTRKIIKGECSREQLRALEGSNDSGNPNSEI